MRERGLKPAPYYTSISPRPSLPMRERGLKPVPTALNCMWTESLPMRERGLKQFVPYFCRGSRCVAPHAGAWVETDFERQLVGIIWSLPMRERGLKPVFITDFNTHVQSLPMRERGLKQEKRSAT